MISGPRKLVNTPSRWQSIAMVRSSDEDAMVVVAAAGLRVGRAAGSGSKSKGWLGFSATCSSRTGTAGSGTRLGGTTRIPGGGGGTNVLVHFGHLTCLPG